MSYGLGLAKPKTKRPTIPYPALIEDATKTNEGKFKAFDQNKLLAVWGNLGSISDVKGGVCRALSAAYLCRQFVSCYLKVDEDDKEMAEAANTMMRLLHDLDPHLLVSGDGKFFETFQEGRLTDDEQNNRRIVMYRAERKPLEVYKSGMAPVFGRGNLLVEKGDRQCMPSLNGVPLSNYSAWRTRRIEHIAEVHHDTRYRGPMDMTEDAKAKSHRKEMVATMKCFSKTIASDRSGQILLAGPYTDSIWNLDAANGFFMCWVKGHALAVAIQTKGSWNGYQVKFFDPNFGECKFKTVENFKAFAGTIAHGFGRVYHQTYMDYLMFR